MPKMIETDGDLAASDADDSADANSMDLGSEASDEPSSEDIMAELGLGPADYDSTADDEQDSDSPDPTDLTDESEQDEEDEQSEDDDQDDDSEEDEDSEEEEDEQDPAELSAQQARIDELTRRNKETEEQLADKDKTIAEMEQRLASAQAAPAAQANSFAHVESAQELQATRDTLIQNKQYLLKNLDGFTQTIEGEEKEYSAEEARALLADVEQKLDVDIPKRVEFLQQREPAIKEAQAAYPDLFKSGTALSKFYSGAVQQIPGLAQQPNSHLIVGDGAIGRLVRMGQFKLVPVDAKGAPAVPARKKPAAKGKRRKAASAAPKRSAAQPAAKETRQKAASKQLSAGDGGVDDMADYLENTVL